MLSREQIATANKELVLSAMGSVGATCDEMVDSTGLKFVEVFITAKYLVKTGAAEERFQKNTGIVAFGRIG